MMLNKIKDVVKTKTASVINGTLIDTMTANLIIQVAGISKEHEEKIESMLNKSVEKTALTLWKLAK
ncbi:MAG: hypothetical protein ACRC51_11085 [Cetobacterium sp.]